MSEHTVTPWIIDGHQIVYDDMEVCRVSGDAWEANAAFIVRACNSHDELLEACKQLVEAASHSGRVIGYDSQVFDRACAAVAKADLGGLAAFSGSVEDCTEKS